MMVELSSRVKTGECAKCGFVFPTEMLYDSYHVAFETSTEGIYDNDEVEVCQKCWYDTMMFVAPRGKRK